MHERRVPTDDNRIREVIHLALKARNEKQLFFSKEVILPELPYINLLLEHGQETNDDKFAINALFLTTSFVFAEKTQGFFERITDKRKLERFAWIFDPKKALPEPDEVMEAALRSFFQPRGYNANSIKAWKYNLAILEEKYDGDFRNFLKANENDAPKVVKALYVRNRAKTKEKEGTFRRYGPKLATLAVQWIAQYKLCELKNAEKIGVPLDFQLARIFIQTDGVLLKGRVNVDSVVYRTLMPKIKQICKDEGIDPREVSETLWLIGSQLCSSRLHDQCPLESICTKLISSNSYQREGILDPTDIGRFNN